MARGRRSVGADRPVPALGELLAGRPDRPVRPVLGAVPRPRRSQYGSPEDLPGGENERFLEYWNLVFMQYDQEPAPDEPGSVLKPLPANNIDTGLGLNRMAAILQDKQSVFETDQFQPLIELGEELSGSRYGDDFDSDRALRILADHSRAMTFLTADGVVPSNEDRGYVLRRVMRRAIQQGLALELAPGFLTRYAERVREVMGARLPRTDRAGRRDRHVARGRGGGLRADARAGHGAAARPHSRRRRGGPLDGVRGRRVHAARHARLPLRDDQRAARRAGPLDRGRLRGADGGAARARPRRRVAGRRGGPRGSPRAGARSTAVRRRASPGTRPRSSARPCSRSAPSTGSPTRAPRTARRRSRLLVKLAESPFYLAGGGQVSDVGTIECDDGDCRARVEDVVVIGEDRVAEVIVEEGTLEVGEQVLARVDHLTRHKTECNHTATHLLQAALRERVGSHVRQAGSYVGPDKLRFDFSHGQALSAEELRDVEDRVNEWIARNDPVRAITTTLDEAKRLGAMALFGEKYGEVVRMVEVGEGEYSRELCGGTHVRSTAEIGAFRILHETSSSANVRRIEAVTGPGRGRAAARARPPARRDRRAAAHASRGRPRRRGERSPRSASAWRRS